MTSAHDPKHEPKHDPKHEASKRSEPWKPGDPRPSSRPEEGAALGGGVEDADHGVHRQRPSPGEDDGSFDRNPDAQDDRAP